MASDKSLRLLSLINQMEAQESLNQYRKLQMEQQKSEYQRLVQEQQAKQKAAGLIGERFSREYGPIPDLNQNVQMTMEDLLAQGTPSSIEYADTLKGFIKGSHGADSDAYNALLRAYGQEAPFLVQNYGGGKVPLTQADLQEMTLAAAQDPEFNNKRQEWSNIRSAGRFQDLGTLAEDPTKRGAFDPKRNAQVVTGEVVGDTVNRELQNVSEATAKDLSLFKTAVSAVDTIYDNFDAKYVGPLQGNWKAIASKVTNDPEFTAFQNEVKRMREIVYPLTGKQINESELKWLDTILAKLSNPDENFKANLQEVRDWLADKHNQYQSELKAARRYISSAPIEARTYNEGAKEKSKPNAGGSEPKRIRIKVQ